MIQLSRYKLTEQERATIEAYLSRIGNKPSLEQIWQLMDEAWERASCSQSTYQADQYGCFYADPVWLLNGIFIEQDPVSMGHRHSIANAAASLRPKRVLDFGGGFGTLARLIAGRLPNSEIAIYDPYPPLHGLQSRKAYPNIQYIDDLTKHIYDALVCTDVLEHVHDPLGQLARMVAAVQPGGHLFIANCFYPVILCHLPCTFHLRHFFSWCAEPLGLECLGPCEGSHAWIYRRRADGSMHLRQARLREALAKVVAPVLTHIAIPARRRLRAWVRARTSP